MKNTAGIEGAFRARSFTNNDTVMKSERVRPSRTSTAARVITPGASMKATGAAAVATDAAGGIFYPRRGSFVDWVIRFGVRIIGPVAYDALSFAVLSAFVLIMKMTGDDLDDDVTEDGFTLLMEASRMGNKMAVRALIKAGANVNHVGENGATALTIASENGHARCIHELVKAGAIAQHKKHRRHPTKFVVAPMCEAEAARARADRIRAYDIQEAAMRSAEREKDEMRKRRAVAERNAIAERAERPESHCAPRFTPAPWPEHTPLDPRSSVIVSARRESAKADSIRRAEEHAAKLRQRVEDDLAQAEERARLIQIGEAIGRGVW